jgi:hypothetical protein
MSKASQPSSAPASASAASEDELAVEAFLKALVAEGAASDPASSQQVAQIQQVAAKLPSQQQVATWTQDGFFGLAALICVLIGVRWLRPASPRSDHGGRGERHDRGAPSWASLLVSRGTKK